MSARFGLGVPFGDATGERGDTMSSRYSNQVAFELALGGKPTPSLYIGAYGGVWGGSEGDDEYASSLCADSSGREVDCGSLSTRLGAEIQWHFLPAGGVNPWIGFGLAYEWASESITDHVANRTEESRVHGMQLGRLQAGVDFRLGKVFGLGPYTQVEFGRYLHQTTEIYGRQTHSGEIEHKATHGWFGSGLRLVFFP